MVEEIGEIGLGSFSHELRWDTQFFEASKEPRNLVQQCFERLLVAGDQKKGTGTQKCWMGAGVQER